MALLLLELEILRLGSSFLRCLAITRARFRGATNVYVQRFKGQDRE